jgi:hypothetical protein
MKINKQNIENYFKVTPEVAKQAMKLIKACEDPEETMEKLDTLLNCYNVEAIPNPDDFRRPFFIYLNTGDLYNNTLIYSYMAEEYLLTTPADIIEELERESLEEPNVC